MELKRYKLSDIASVDISSVDKKSYPGQKPVRLCNFTDVYYNWAITAQMESSLMDSTASDSEIERYTLRKGQVCITKDSETRDDIGVAAYIADTIDNMVLGYHCAVITPDEDKLDGAYLNAFLHSSFAQRYFECNASGSGQRYTLTLDSIKDLQLVLPSIEEQRKVAKLLSDLDRKIELNKSINANLEAMAKQLYDYWFVQFDFPDENGRPYKSSGGKMVWNEKLKREIPEGWDVCQLDEACFLNKEALAAKNLSTSIKYLDTSNITQNIIDSIQEFEAIEDIPSRARRTVKSGTIIYSSVRPSQRHYGILVAPDKELIVSTGFITLDVKADCQISPYQVYLYVSSDEVVDRLNGIAVNSVSSYPSINPSDIGGLFIVQPPITLSQQFSSSCRDYYMLIDKNQVENKELQKQRDELLPLLMNGQVSITK